MIFDGRPIDEIKDGEFDSLIQKGISEHQYVEYKETCNIKVDDDKIEILRDIASLANAGGGYLIIGIQDDGTGKALGYRAHTEQDLIKMKQSIMQLCLDHIAERIPRLEFRIRNPSGHPILVIQIPDSIQVPYMVKFGRRTDFYTRYDEGKREMSITEIRRAFQGDKAQLTLDLISHQIGELSKVLQSKKPSSSETPSNESIPLFPTSIKESNTLVEIAYERMKNEVKGNPYFWIAATPTLLGDDMLDVDSPKIRQLVSAPPGSRVSGWNMERPGLTNSIPDGIERGTKDSEYLTLYRNGHMEFWTPLDEHFCWGQKKPEFEKKPELYPYPVVEYPVTFLRLYKAILDSFGFKGDFIINLRYLTLKGYRLRPYRPGVVGYMFTDELKPYQYDHLRLPPFVEHQSFNPDSTAHKLLTKVYSAFGLSSNTIPFYDSGEFRFPS
jgi:hypothetical protein